MKPDHSPSSPLLTYRLSRTKSQTEKRSLYCLLTVKAMNLANPFSSQAASLKRTTVDQTNTLERNACTSSLSAMLQFQLHEGKRNGSAGWYLDWDKRDVLAWEERVCFYVSNTTATWNYIAKLWVWTAGGNNIMLFPLDVSSGAGPAALQLAWCMEEWSAVDTDRRLSPAMGRQHRVPHEIITTTDKFSH
jgi:hypothetical protein